MVSLSAVDSLLVATLVLLVGRLLSTRIGFLGRYSIPDPVIGGLLFAIGVFVLSTYTDIEIGVDTSMSSTFLLIFFSCIGLTADLRLLRRGGPRLVLFLLALAPFIVLQNLVGLGMAWVLDLHPLMGVLAGSITMLGGHGTGAAYAVGFSDVYNIQDIMALAMMSATIGLILGGVVGGPVGEWLLRRYQVPVPGGTAEAREEVEVLNGPEGKKPGLDAFSFIAALAAVFVCLGVGELLAETFADLPVNIPGFLWCLITGILIRNLGPFVKLELNDRASDIVGSVALSLFLAFSMMTIDLASASRLAGPLLLILAVQACVCIVYAAFFVFRIMRKDYEAAVISAAFCGFGLGATATAVANMQALSRRHGHAPEAFIVVPITGAFLVDIMNVVVLSLLISLPFIGGF
ncbi:MAG TPA: sodium/glutamate symporter [Burkholderiaceae bacterium]|nr:sodium/glutamate symporter [Burkholderiaceae bacterium]